MNPVERAIQVFGTQTALAAACGQPPQAVTRWLSNGEVPPKYAARIERLTHGRVTKRELSPGFDWGDQPQEAA